MCQKLTPPHVWQWVYNLKLIEKHHFERAKKLIENIYEPHREETGFLPMRKQRRRSASR